MSPLNIVLLLLTALCAAAGAAQPHNYKAFEVAGCLEATLLSQCRTTGALVDSSSGFPVPTIPSAGVWRTDFACCKDKHKPTQGQRTDDLSSFAATRPRVAQCDWNVEVYKELDEEGYETVMPMREDGILKAGDASGVCRINAKADDCEGQAFCEDGMTLTIQGGYYVTAAYSKEPGNLIKAPKGDVCATMEQFNAYNNLFACGPGSAPNEQVQADWWAQMPGKSAARNNKTSTAGTANTQDKNKNRRLLGNRQINPGESSTATLMTALFGGVVSSGYYSDALQTLGVTYGGPIACTSGTGEPIRGGPYGGLAYSIIGTATVSTVSGKFEEVGRVEFTPFFVAVGQKLKATQDLPWVKGGGLKMYLELKDQ